MNINKNISWDDIVTEYTNNPKDVITVPISKTRKGIWFYVHTENGNVYITSAEYHTNSSKISKPIKLQKSKFDDMLRLYMQRKNGIQVSQEATATSYQQVYWYGIFSDLCI